MSFNYRIDSTVLIDPTRAKHVIIPEVAAGLRMAELPIAFRDGAYVSDDHSTDVKVVPMKIDLAGATPAAVYTAYHNLMDLIYGGKKTLAKLDPDAGEVEAEVIVGEETSHGNGSTRQRLEFPLTFTRGHWATAAVTTEVDNAITTSATIGPFTPVGSHRTFPKFTIECTAPGDNPSIEEPVSGALLLLAGSFIATDVIVIDVDARLVTLNGTRAKNLLTVNRGYWMRFDPNVAYSLDWVATSGTWDVDTEWKDRYR